MNKKDYKNQIEEHRKPITLDRDEQTNSRISRRSSNQPVKQVKTRKNYLLPIVFTIFILIPIGFLIYIQFFYEPTQNETAVIDNDEVEFEQNEENRVDTEVADEVDENENEADTSEGDETSSADPDEATEHVEENPVKETSGEELEQEATPSTKTHTVQPDETLYRIAMNYYNSPDAVDKIKDANELTSDSISTGQVLILP